MAANLEEIQREKLLTGNRHPDDHKNKPKFEALIEANQTADNAFGWKRNLGALNRDNETDFNFQAQ